MGLDCIVPSEADVELSLIIPVYNGAKTISALVEEIHRLFDAKSFEVILIDDGSVDESPKVCDQLVDRYPETVSFFQLSRNYGEHHAVLAGLNVARGEYLSVLDDDGQNPPEEIPRMLKELKLRKLDVMYGCYRIKQHHWFRNLGSQLNDWMATRMLGKPKNLYLASFKVMTRFVSMQVIRYRGAFPYIDGLIFRTTRNIDQIIVEHKTTEIPSRYGLMKLLGLWGNMFLGYSILPLRISALMGLCTSVFSVLFIVYILIDKLYYTRNLTLGIPTTLATITFFAGTQLLILGLVGEYLGRLYQDHSGNPQFIIRHSRQRVRKSTPRPTS